MEAIRASLPENAVLLEYYRVRDTFYACVLSRRTLKIVPVASVPELRRALQLLRFQLSKFRLGAEYVSTFQAQLLEATKAHLRHFHASLIAPLAADLEAEHLIITPHDFLHYVPFHALLDGSDYLGSRYSISYAPSATVYYLCAAKQPGPAGGALVLGVPDPAAPQIGKEVEAVASVLPEAEIFLGREATYNVLRERGAGARYIHIATHGWFRQDNPMFSSISLGTSELSLFDLYQLNLPAELITLSGCGTGLDMVVGGDELHRAQARTAVCGCARAAAHPVGRARREHGGIHEAVLPAAQAGPQQGARGAIRHGGNPAGVPAPVLLGAVRAGGQVPVRPRDPLARKVRKLSTVLVVPVRDSANKRWVPYIWAPQKAPLSVEQDYVRHRY